MNNNISYSIENTFISPPSYSSVQIRNEWELFIEGNYRSPKVWEKDNIMHDTDRDAPSRQIIDAEPRDYLPGFIDKQIAERINGGKGLVLGFGKKPYELYVLQEAFNLIEVHGVDWVRDRIIEAAKSLAAYANDKKQSIETLSHQFKLHHADSVNLRFLEDNSIDIIYSSGMLTGRGVLYDPYTVKEMLRVLKPGGVAVLIHSGSYAVEHLDEGKIEILGEEIEIKHRVKYLKYQMNQCPRIVIFEKLKNNQKQKKLEKESLKSL